MKKIISLKKLKTLSKTSIAMLVILCSLFSASSVLAWGPKRQTFTMDDPASYPTFNSITDNPTIGDERNFVRVGEIDADVTRMKNEVEIVPGKQYLVYIYIHNNASETYNDAAHDRVGIALRTRLSSSFSSLVTPSSRGTITATVTADNSNPASVWDEAYMTTQNERVFLRYVSGSAKIYNKWAANGSVLSTNLFSEEGTLIGLNGLNGVIPGCEQYHNIVTYVLQAEELNGTIEKTVSKDGKNYKEKVSIAPGEKVYFQLTIRNTGNMALSNAVVKDALPAGLTLVPGSVKLHANDSTVLDQLSDSLVSAGHNLGTVGAGNVIYITFEAIAGTDFDCDGQDLVNTASLEYDSNESTGDKREDTASVNVKKTEGCEEKPKPTCEEDPTQEGCEKPKPTCEEDPTQEGCEKPKPTCEEDPTQEDCKKPEEPEKPEKTCKDDPTMEGCQELPSTGPLEIAMAILIVLGICGGGYYFYRSKKNLNKIEQKAKGQDVEPKA